jgi:K+-transporting ATPase KdpF subunit
MNAKMMSILMTVHEQPVPNGHTGYLIGGLIALFILGYLIYTLLRPEEF